MAKLDPEQRRRHLAEAVWRVVLRDGIESASVRNVAAEAGLSAGSLRHVFPSQSELLAFAMQLVVDQVRRRVADVEPADDVRETVGRQLESLLVLGPQTRAEFEVWLAFSTRARTDPTLRELRDRTHAQVRELCLTSVQALAGEAGTRTDLDLPREAERLHALVDGLAMHATLDPSTTTPDRQVEILRRHLESLS